MDIKKIRPRFRLAVLLLLLSGTSVALATGIDPVKLNKRLREQHNIVFGLPREDSLVKIKVNPTLLRRGNKQIVDAFGDLLGFARA